MKFLVNLAEFLGSAGEVDAGLAAIDEALQRAERYEELWCMPEVLRIKGELLLLAGAPNAVVAAADHFVQSLDWARRLETLSWELRAAISLARVQGHQGRILEARDLLAPIYERFTEGFGTADLREAKRLIDALP
jgi:predicted ATPase